jgi:hypothetical protein
LAIYSQNAALSFNGSLIKTIHERSIMSNFLEKYSGSRALIIYDNFFFAEKANAIFQSFADATGPWEIRSWRLDGLKLSSEGDLALEEAADARLIVFAGQRAQSLPSWLEEWLVKWFACSRVSDAAFAVIGGKNGEALTMPSRPGLFQFARKHGLNFVVNERLTAEHRTGFIAPVKFKGEAPRFRTPGTSIPAPIHSSHRHWGINE